MIQQDFYSGEPTSLGSPNISSEAEAANMASFGKYDYNSGSRNFYQPNNMNMNQYNQQQQAIGIGAPYFNNGYNQYNNGFNNQYTYTQYGNVAPNRPYNGFFPQQSQMFSAPVQQTTYHIPGFNPGGSEFMPTPDYKDQIEQLELEYWFARQEADVKAEMDMQQSVYGNNNYYGYNYYGMPYYNPYKYNSVDNEFSQKINKIKDDARNTRLQFNINMLKAAHHYLGDDVSEEEIVQACTGKDVTVSSQSSFISPQEYYQYTKFNNLVPFDNSSYYRNARAKHQRELDEIIPPDSNMEETFERLGILYAMYEMEEESHRRRDKSTSYSSADNTYKYFVKRKAKERYAAEHGMMPDERKSDIGKVFSSQLLNGLPTLSQNATIADDGTLNVSLSLPVNVGSHRGETYTIDNQNEAEYNKKREQFGRFLDSIKGDIYLDELKRKKFESTTVL